MDKLTTHEKELVLLATKSYIAIFNKITDRLTVYEKEKVMEWAKSFNKNSASINSLDNFEDHENQIDMEYTISFAKSTTENISKVKKEVIECPESPDSVPARTVTQLKNTKKIIASTKSLDFDESTDDLEENIIKCTKSFDIFPNKKVDELAQHKKEYLSVENVDESTNNELSESITKLKAQGEDQINECDKSFDSVSKSQMNVLTEHENEQATKLLENVPVEVLEELTEHEKDHIMEWTMQDGIPEKSHICSECNKAYATKAILKNHMKIHSSERPFICNICPKSFKHRGTLQSHKRIHTGEKPFVCRFCNKGCITSSNLRVHERTHTNEEPYECPFCEQRFQRWDQKKSHERIHTDEENPHKCDICKKTFTRRQSLKRHTIMKGKCSANTDHFFDQTNMWKTTSSLSQVIEKHMEKTCSDDDDYVLEHRNEEYRLKAVVVNLKEQ